jgi:hypothetical protein
MSEKCSKFISSNFTVYQCGKPAKFEANGKHFCGIHNPDKAPTKAQVQAKENYKKQLTVWRINAAAPDLLSACERARWCITGLLHGTPVRDADETLSEIDAAIAKARK